MAAAKLRDGADATSVDIAAEEKRADEARAKAAEVGFVFRVGLG